MNRAWSARALLLLLLAACASCRIVYAADPLSYRIRIASTGNEAVDEAVEATSQLVALREKGPVSPFALILRAQEDVERLRTVLESFGYYRGQPTVTVADRALDEPGLADTLAALPADTAPEVRIGAGLGPRFRIGEVRLEGDVPEGARALLGLEPGAPAVAADVLAAGQRLEAALLNQGRALARVPPPVAYLNPQQETLDLVFNVEAGPQVRLGEIELRGLDRVNASFVRNRLLVHPGDAFDPEAIERARRDLLELNVFSAVAVSAGKALDDSGRLPLTFDVQERPPRVLGLNGAWSTDLGGSLGANWSHRNLFGGAEQLNLSASAINLGGSATTGIGYNVRGQYIRPDFLQRDQSLEFRLGALKQSLEAYDQTAVLGGVFLNRKLSATWTGSVGVSVIQQEITQQGVTRDYTLLGVPVGLKYDSTGRSDPLLDPTRGVVGSATVTPTLSLAQGEAEDAYFTVLQVSASTYIDLARFDLAPAGRSVVALRALVASALGADQFDLPPDQRFYGGGSGTVRGFRYQSIGPRFPDGTPQGGTALDAASIEFRQRVGSDWGAVAFVDAGHVSANGGPFEGKLHVGAGVGVRWYTPIGPLRVDVAVPITDVEGNDAFQVYIGLGQAF